jgi:hypothetical protein
MKSLVSRYVSSRDSYQNFPPDIIFSTPSSAARKVITPIIVVIGTFLAIGVGQKESVDTERTEYYIEGST